MGIAETITTSMFLPPDYGESWKAIRNGIPDSAGSVHVVREHLVTTTSYSREPSLGLWASWIAEQNWTSAEKQFPDGASGRHPKSRRENDLWSRNAWRSIWYSMTYTDREDGFERGDVTSDILSASPAILALGQSPLERGEKAFTATRIRHTARS